MTKSIYLAARFGRREELRTIAAALVARGFGVTSRWLEVEEDQLQAPQGPRWAERDLEDVLCSDTLVAFTDAPATPGAERGGRHVEFGAAAVAGKRLILVGPVEHLFHRLPQVERVESASELIRLLEVTT